MNTPRSFIAIGLAIAFVIAAIAPSWAEDLPREPLEIITASGETHVFDVEVAKTSEERRVGLMFRTELAPNRGMLFDFLRPQRVSFWMKNTLIPLDMLFIDAEGRVESIRERAVPKSLMPIESKGRIRAVLEVPGGTVDRLGLRVGDRVHCEIFPRP